MPYHCWKKGMICKKIDMLRLLFSMRALVLIDIASMIIILSYTVNEAIASVDATTN